MRAALEEVQRFPPSVWEEEEVFILVLKKSAGAHHIIDSQCTGLFVVFYVFILLSPFVIIGT